MNIPSGGRRDNWTREAQDQFEVVRSLLDGYLGGLNPLMVGTGTGGDDPPTVDPPSMDRRRCPFYKAVFAWLDGVWHGGYSGMTSLQKEPLDLAMRACRSKRAADRQKRRRLRRLARWIAKEDQREFNRRCVLAQPAALLTDDDVLILTVLDANRGKALSFRKIINESTRMNSEDRALMPRRLNAHVLRSRLPYLIGLVERPPGTKNKGVGINQAGHDALAFVRTNTTQS